MPYGRPKTQSPKAELVHIRLSAIEKEAFKEAAEMAGIGLSTWIRERLRLAAVREHEEAGSIPAFVRRPRQD